MKTTLLLLLSLSAFAADSTAPTLTDKQKLDIREAQLQVVSISAEKSALESRLKDLTAALPGAQQELGNRMKAAAPAGYSVQPDLTLRPDAKPAAAITKPE